MPEQPFIARVPAGNRPAARQPIWAPNPAVPPAARILAYAFGILTLLTVMISINYTRPADLPVVPDKWQTYSTENFSIPYPDGWDVDSDDSDARQQEVTFTQIPDPYIHVTAVCFKARGPISAESTDRLKAELEKMLSKQYIDFKVKNIPNTSVSPAATPNPVDNWNRFSGRHRDEQKHQIVGAWVLKIQGSRALFIEGISTEDGWANMEKILSSMNDYATLAADPITPGYGYMNRSPSDSPNADPNAYPNTGEYPSQ